MNSCGCGNPAYISVSDKTILSHTSECSWFLNSDFTNPVKTEPDMAFVRDPFVLNKDLNLYLCLVCSYFVEPKTEHVHFRNHFPQSASLFSLEHLKPTNLARFLLPKGLLAPIDGLKIEDGFRCSECNEFHNNHALMMKHLTMAHDLRAPSHIKKCTVQTLFNNQLYFGVDPCLPQNFNDLPPKVLDEPVTTKPSSTGVSASSNSAKRTSVKVEAERELEAKRPRLEKSIPIEDSKQEVAEPPVYQKKLASYHLLQQLKQDAKEPIYAFVERMERFVQCYLNDNTYRMAVGFMLHKTTTKYQLLLDKWLKDRAASG